jgi:SAM-dependent methyltransferase
MSERPSFRADDPAYVRYQYSDDEKLRIRIETHERYSERRGFHRWVIGHIAAQPGHWLLDVGSGPGTDYHPLLDGVEIVALDTSLGMLRKVRAKRVNADAQAVPFEDASFDRVMSNHMLYHVRDKPLALREMRRVVKPGGRVTITANLRSSYANLWKLRDAALAELGLTPQHGTGYWFAAEDVDLVRSVLPNVRVEVWNDAFVFPSAEPVLRYLATGPAGLEREEDRQRLFALLRPRIDAIVEREGSFRVPKGAGCFIADVA